jgi:hypothetical protein
MRKTPRAQKQSDVGLHAALFARIKDDGRAEASLITVAGLMRNGDL